MNEQIIIDRRYCGPRNSSNGGYICGLMARHIDGVAEITLRKPPPLDKPLTLERQGNQVVLTDGDSLVAEARSGTLDLNIPEPPTFEAATKALEHYRGFEYHAWPYCYVCGPLHGDGMGIYPGPVKGRAIVASPWVPELYQSAVDGTISPEFQWAALDCPGFFAIDGTATRLLGQLTARINHSVKVGEKCVTIGWHIQSRGRKYTVGTALFSETGDLCGAARAQWIEERPRT